MYHENLNLEGGVLRQEQITLEENLQQEQPVISRFQPEDPVDFQLDNHSKTTELKELFFNSEESTAYALRTPKTRQFCKHCDHTKVIRSGLLCLACGHWICEQCKHCNEDCKGLSPKRLAEYLLRIDEKLDKHLGQVEEMISRREIHTLIRNINNQLRILDVLLDEEVLSQSLLKEFRQANKLYQQYRQLRKSRKGRA